MPETERDCKSELACCNAVSVGGDWENEISQRHEWEIELSVDCLMRNTTLHSTTTNCNRM